MMKSILCSLALMAMACVPAMAQKKAASDAVHFKGDVKGVKDTLLVIVPQGDQKAKTDTVLVKNGKFDFTVHVSEPTDIRAYTPGSLRGTERAGFQVIAVPGESAVMSGDLTSNYYLTGSKFYQQFNEVDRMMEAAQKPMQQLVDSLQNRMKAGESQESVMKVYQEKGGKLRQELRDKMMNFIKQHPDDEACAYLIPQMDDLETMKEAVKLLSPAVRDGRMKNYYTRVISSMEAEEKAEAEAAKKQAAGIAAPNFTLNDINGKPLSLSSLRGQYVILDFWGSWCIWCIKGFPEMKEYYNKYKGKFQILGVDCNDTQEKWKAAVQKHELPWLHVYCPRDNRQLMDAYGIQGFPTKILIDPQGKIVKTVVGEDPAFYTLLDETFGKK
jgi:thiol-disulfide isomerase/thioredoxin